MSAGILALLALMVSRAGAQSNTAPVRLAIIVEEPSAVAAADLLTVELSQRSRLTRFVWSSDQPGGAVAA